MDEVVGTSHVRLPDLDLDLEVEWNRMLDIPLCTLAVLPARRIPFVCPWMQVQRLLS
jgi:hypothetical protein